MKSEIKLIPDVVNKPAVGLGGILNILGVLKELVARYDVDWNRIPELFTHINTLRTVDYHTVEGLRSAVHAVVELADIFVLSTETADALKSALANDSLLSLLVNLVNLIDPPAEGQKLNLIEPISVADLAGWLPIILQVLDIIRKLRG